MSALDLRELLAEPGQNGAYFVDVRDREALADAANALDFAVATIDLAGCLDKQEVLSRFAQALRFPDWFGGNWDALADCLGDLSWWPAGGYLLLLDHAGAWRASDTDGFATLLDILNEAARQWAAEELPFWTLIPLSAEALAAIE
jgi:RNAse (barnase) inhibitor barstar